MSTAEFEEDRCLGLEGNSFSGKTTIAEVLQQDYSFKVIREPSWYVSYFPPEPRDQKEANDNFDFFVEAEKRRTEKAREEIQKGHFPVMDRTLWTYIHYEYVRLKREQSKPNAYFYSIDRMQLMVEEGKIILPPLLVALTPGNKSVFQERVQKRGKVGVDFLNQWETTLLVDNFYLHLIGIYGGRNSKQTLTNRDIQEIAFEIKNFADNYDPSSSLDIKLAFDSLRNLIPISCT